MDFLNLFIILKEGVPAGPYLVLADAQAAGAVTINYGQFINAVVAFIIVAFALFLIVRWVLRMQRQPEELVDTTTKQCPECQSIISIDARRCAFCTSQLAVP